MEEEGTTAPPEQQQITFHDLVVQVTRERLNSMLPLLLDETRCAIMRAASNGKTQCFFPKQANRQQIQALAKALRGDGFQVTDNKISWDRDI